MRPATIRPKGKKTANANKLKTISKIRFILPMRIKHIIFRHFRLLLEAKKFYPTIYRNNFKIWEFGNAGILVFEAACIAQLIQVDSIILNNLIQGRLSFEIFAPALQSRSNGTLSLPFPRHCRGFFHQKMLCPAFFRALHQNQRI